MSQSRNNHDRQVIAWLDQFSRDLETDLSLLEALPIEEVQTELQALGADVEGFHARLTRILRNAKTYTF